MVKKTSPFDPSGFADDIAMTFIGSDPNLLVVQAQPFIDMAVEWGGKNGLTFSTDKTTVVFFNRKNGFDMNSLKKLKINGCEIKPKN